MALMFRSVLQNSGGAAELIVTCASQFAGETISCSDGTTTLTKTCPSSSPYTVTFKIPNSGNWTISATVSGVTYTSDPVTVELEYAAALNYGFVWQAWVDSASLLDSSDYASLSEVLADEEAVRELFVEHAPVDYLCSFAAVNEDLETVIYNDICAKWINLSDYALDSMYANAAIKTVMDTADKYGYGEWTLMPQVPTMTSNTAPYGEVIFNGTNYSEFYPYYVFDGSDTESSRWACSIVSFGQACYIGYHFTSPIKLAAIKIKFISGITSSTCQVQGSNDGTNWTNIGEPTNVGPLDDNLIPIVSSQAYEYYRVYITNQTQTTTRAWAGQVQTLQFYAWAPKGNVPVMTSNTAPYGTAFASTTYNTSYSAWKAFDGVVGNESDSWHSAAGLPAYIGYTFANPIKVKRFSLRNRGTTGSITHAPVTFKIQASNDGFVNDSHDLSGSITSKDTTSIQESYYDVDNNDYYSTYRIYIFTSTSQYAALSNLQFYGRELSVSVPTMTSNTAPYGTAFGKSQYSATSTYYKAFDNVVAGSVWNSANGEYNSYVGYAFDKPVVVKQFYWQISAGSDRELSPKTYYLEASNNSTNGTDGTWESLGQFTNSSTTASDIIRHDVSSNTSSYKFYRMHVTELNNNYTNYVVIAELQFYGLDYSEKEFEVGTTKKWLYDHGVELETYTKRTGSSGVEVVMGTDSFTAQGGSASTNSYSYIYVGALDLTDYNAIRCKVGKDFVTKSYISIENPIGTTISEAQLVVGSLPNANGLACDSVNQSAYCSIGVGSGGNGKTEFTEWWLE